jgi:sugar transferase (PEP-CTERM/EpsH1 system associated)
MKVLFVCHRFPYPPSSGAKVRAFHIIRHLSDTGHEVTVASLARSYREAQEGHGIAPYCARYEMAQVHEPIQAARMLMRLPTLTPSSMGFFYSPALAQRVRKLVESERFDLVYVYCSSVAQYVADVRGIPKILDFLDMDSQKWLDYARFKSFPLAAGYWVEGKKLERAEKRLARAFDLCTTITRAEWETLESYRTGVATDWFPNGVDTSYFAPTGDGYDADTICFVGRMDYYPNQECMIDFCAKVLPLVRARRAQTRLLIVGADPSRAVRKLGDLPGVTVTGSVPDVRPYLWRSALMVAPLNIARGTQNKILEAMAAGVPVVASRVAAGGVDAVANEHFLAASTPEEYERAVTRILDHPAQRQQFSAAGRKRMLTHHAWDRSMERLDSIIARCMSTWRDTRSGLAGSEGRSVEAAPPSAHNDSQNRSDMPKSESVP